MAIVKNFNEFDPKKGTSLKEKEQKGTGNQDSNARKAIANLAAAELEIQKKTKERIKLAKDWAAASDEERPDLLDQLKKIQNEVQELNKIVAKSEKEFNVASGVEVLEVENVAVEEKDEEMEEEIKAAAMPPKEEEASKPVDIAKDNAEGSGEEEHHTSIQEGKEDDYLIFNRK
jgi:hypothetical protein